MNAFPVLQPTPDEFARRDAVMAEVLRHIREGITIRLPAFDPSLSQSDPDFALLRIGAEPNDFAGTIGEFWYQFEGEEDLLHLMVTEADGQPLSAEQGQAVCSFVLPTVPPALMWFRPGERSQHFYFGHDILV